jgi:Skp family chaperone for outer membrane proteins
VISGKIKAAGKKYAQKHGLDILMADSENGSQFNYINPTMDVTKEFIRFINQEEEEINAIAKEK